MLTTSIEETVALVPALSLDFAHPHLLGGPLTCCPSTSLIVASTLTVFHLGFHS